MKVKVDITEWAWQKVPKLVAEKVVLVDGPTTVKDIVLEIVVTIQDIAIEEYVANWKIKTVAVKMFELNELLKMALGPEELFVVWRFIDKAIDHMIEVAIEAECYEGVVNLKKLKESI